MRSISDRNGGIEGVPLQLIIAVVVGMAALAIVIGWITIAGDTDATLRRVTTDPDTIQISGEGRINLTVNVTVYIYDSNGDEVNGAIITISGSVDDKVVEKVDSGDTVQIPAVLSSNSDTAVIDVTAEKSGGMGTADTTIIVMRG